MNKFGQMSLVLLVVAACHVYGQVKTSTPCSLSFYRYLYNLPGEQIRPNVPEGTYMFGKRVGPASPEGQASNVKPSIVQPEASYEAPLYLPPPSTTTTTTTLRPSTAAPVYIPPPSQTPYYPAESINTVSVVKPACDHPEHKAVYNELLPPYQTQPQPQPTFQPRPTFKPQPTFQPQPTFFVPRFAPPPKPQVQVAIRDNEIIPEQRKPVAVQRFAVPTPPPQFLRPYIAPAPAAVPAENCDKHVHVTSTTTTSTTTTTTTPEPSTERFEETRQNEISVSPNTKPDCGHKHHNVVIDPQGVPSTDYGVVSPPASVPSASAGYSYDRPSEPLAYPSSGYTYPKASPSFEYPGAFSAQGTALFEADSPKASSSGTEDGDLVILKV